ncbi:MAG: thiamine-phosphate kinase [Polyangiaceae bacterium]
MTSSPEHARIAELRRIFEARSPHVLVGIGDDAAVLARADGAMVVSVDAHVEGVHFTRALMPLRDAGWRATMAALSDLAAMGAEPTAVFSAIGLPRSASDEELYEVARGQAEAARAARTTIAGGNLTANAAIAITTTVIGVSASPVLRSGARPGDAVWLGGDVGWSAAGLHLLQRAAPTEAPEERAVRAFRRPVARIALGRGAARAGVTAMIDVSDGLTADARHVAEESGVDVCLDEDALRDDELGALAGGELAEAWVLGGGEDFALLATAPAALEIEGMRRVGWCRTPTAARPGVYVGVGALERRVDGLGFDHFRG